MTRSGADDGRRSRKDGTAAGNGRSVAWFHCFAGIAGDMALGSLLDAGADLAEVLALLDRLPVSGWALEVRPVLRAGVAAAQAVVTVEDSVVVRTHAHIVGLIEEARLPDRVARRSLAIFASLADVEAALHRRRVDQVHFHEVGGHDTIIDIVGTAAALEVLGVDEVRASPVATGLGMIRSGHGMLPNPAPAVVALLEGVPTWGRNVAAELTTPTGAAIVATLASGFGPMPAMRVTGQGFGAGTRDLDELPNCTQVVTGVRADRITGADFVSAPDAPGTPGPSGTPRAAWPALAPSEVAADPDPDPDADGGQPVALVEANVDDATGEQLAHAVAALLDAGAHDAWLTPVVMKKGRPGSVVHALADPASVPRIRDVIRETTGSLGVRVTNAERWPAARSLDSVWVEGHLVRIKVSARRIKAEHADVAAVARRTGWPLREVAFRAEAQWRAEHGHPVGPGPDGRTGASRRLEGDTRSLDDASAGSNGPVTEIHSGRRERMSPSYEEPGGGMDDPA